MKKYLTKTFIVFSLLILCCSKTTFSQDDYWKFLTEAYVFFPLADGKIGINGTEATVKSSPEDLFNNFNTGGGFYFEAKYNKVALTSDFLLFNDNEEIVPDKIINSGTTTQKQFTWDAGALYQIADFWEFGIGGRFNSVKTGFDAETGDLQTGTAALSENQSAAWFDPLIVTRISGNIRNKWLFQLKADIGGFGIGSEGTWQVQGYAGYKFPKAFQISLGYRILSVQYKEDTDTGEFLDDINNFGPVIKLGYNF